MTNIVCLVRDSLLSFVFPFMLSAGFSTSVGWIVVESPLSSSLSHLLSITRTLWLPDVGKTQSLLGPFVALSTDNERERGARKGRLSLCGKS